AETPGAERPGDLVATVEALLGPDSLLLRALGGSTALPLVGDGVFNDPRVRAAELPAANGVTTARSLARMYAATIGPVEGADAGPSHTPEQPAVATGRKSEGRDRLIVLEAAFVLGYVRSSDFSPCGSPRSLGHAGAGGSVDFAAPENGLGFGYVMNRMVANLS